MRQGVLRRAQAWAITGPPGHLWSVTIDIAIAWARYLGRRISRGRGASARRRRTR